MKNKRGFTLIELLAIIVILAIIAVITVPIILGIIEDASKGAASDSAYGFKDSVNKYYVSELVKDSNFKLNDGTYTVSEVNGNAVLTGEETYTISLSGTVPTGGSVIIENNDVVGGNIQIGNYCINLSDMTVTKGSCGDTPIAQATPESCFEYEQRREIVVKDVNACVNALMSTETFSGYDGASEDATALCNGGIIGGFDLDFVLKTMIQQTEGIDLVSLNQNAFEVNNLNEVEITGYTCGGHIIELDYENETYTYTNGSYMDVVIPNKIDGKNVTSIGEVAFSPLVDTFDFEISYDKNVIINSVVMPNSVTSIRTGAFMANQLTNITIPSSVTYIGVQTFANNQLTSIEIPNSVTYIGGHAFEYNQLTSVEIPNSVTSIGDLAFAYNQLTYIVLGNSVVELGNTCFYKGYGYNDDGDIVSSNLNLTTIYNNTGRSFDWGNIITVSGEFETGTLISNELGNIIVTTGYPE